MVLRQGKHGVNTGRNVCSHCHSICSRYKTEGFVFKFLLNSTDSSDAEQVTDLLAQDLPDGDLPVYRSDKYFTSDTVSYSINKHKRWTLPQQIIDLIDEGDLEEEDYRLVMHKRVSHSWYNKYLSNRGDTMSYHDTKYTVHHSHPKKSLSSMSDLKLNCHRKQQELARSTSTPTVKLRKHKKKTHFRGIQRKISTQPKETPSRINIPEVLNGDFHNVSVPEVRYEVNYQLCSSSKRTRCKFHKYISYYEAPHMKSKGCCSKPSPQWYFKNISSSDQRLYQNGYRDDEELSCFEEEFDCLDEEASMYLHNEPVHATLADFCLTPGNRPRNSLSKRSHGHKTPNTASGNNSGAYFGKNKVIHVEHPDSGSEEKEVKKYEVIGTGVITSAVTNLVWDNADFDSDGCRCVIEKESMENYRLAHPGEFHVGSCIPQMVKVSVTGETTQGSLVLWQKSEWSAVSRQDPEYWIRVQSDQVNTKELSTSLQSQLQLDRVFTIQEVVLFVRNLLDQFSQHHRCIKEKKHKGLGIGQLAATLCGSVVELGTVKEAFNTLISTEDTQRDRVTQDMNSLLSSFYVFPINLSNSSSVFGFCETCLCQSDAPYTEGCILMPCSHYFCVDCWRRHIWEKIHEGALKITCQTYGCDSVVDEVMVSCLLPSDVVSKWIYRNMESLVESSQKWQWCPKTSCRTVAKLSNPGKRFSPVLCVCGKAWCFSCRSDVHWPATCDQYSVYKKMLLQNGDDGRWTPVETMTYYVQVKQCPKCHYPMEKNGGCSQMRCKCSHSFCWECLKDWSSHVAMNMLVCAKNKKEEVTMELDNNISYAFPIKMYKKSVEHRHKWIRILNVETVEAKAKFYAVKAARQRSTKYRPRELMDYEIYKLVKSSLVFVREVHMVIENIYTMLSNSTQKSGVMNMISLLLDKLLFSTGRLEQIFASPRLTDDHLRRSDHLETSIRRYLEQMALYVPHIQQQISKSKQTILGKPINTFTNFY
ncbi:uncharacterized protein LOC132547763 [Ylistrum balloti]|uniref:uncharacterized protein LOC132547763 n=1 Tax=Ylistrum balloti TaxID=509963 RepID=UPI002905A2C9|nr:uncharacterized protein LOC132547763 [Ylistrum balloti]